MSLSALFLDEGPLSWVVNKPGENAEHDACRAWVLGLMAQGVAVCVAEVTDYELRRELLRQEARREALGQPKRGSVAHLDAFISIPGRYVPISTNAMRRAAELWADVRNLGLTTAPKEALDGDAIMAAQVQIFAVTEGIPLSEIIVATTNVKHISRFVQADEWSKIKP